MCIWAIFNLSEPRDPVPLDKNELNTLYLLTRIAVIRVGGGNSVQELFSKPSLRIRSQTWMMITNGWTCGENYFIQIQVEGLLSHTGHRQPNIGKHSLPTPGWVPYWIFFFVFCSQLKNWAHSFSHDISSKSSCQEGVISSRCAYENR